MNKVVIYYSKIKEFQPDDYEHCLASVPFKKRESIAKLSQQKNKNASVSAYLLLKEALKLNSINIDDYEYSIGEKGKSFLKYCPYQFSISHSKGFCVVALSLDDVGIDIEKMVPHNSKIERMFTDLDRRFINDSNRKDQAFYQIWTSKEAYVKALGNGLSIPLDSFETTLFAENHLKHFVLDDNYLISVYSKTCSDFKTPIRITL